MLPAHLYATTRMKCEAIYMHSSKFSVRKMCRALGLCESSYYQWNRREEKRLERTRKEQELIKKVKEIFEESNCTYGCRRVRAALKNEGLVLSEYKVRRIMRENGFYPVSTRKFRPGRKGKPDGRFYENELSQDFRSDKMNEKWVGDITYIKTCMGWVYLAVVMDLYNREIIGYAVSKSMGTELTCRALRDAIKRNGGPGELLIFHSDRGCQYSSRSFQSLLEENNIRGSMSKSGCPYDNSAMESFFASLKKEYFSRREYATIEAVEKDLYYYIEIFYNRKRLHSTLGYMSPVAYRIKNAGKKSA